MLNTHKRVLKSKVKYSGCTVHFVTPVLDSGKIVLNFNVQFKFGFTHNIWSFYFLRIGHAIRNLFLYCPGVSRFFLIHGAAVARGAKDGAAKNGAAVARVVSGSRLWKGSIHATDPITDRHE